METNGVVILVLSLLAICLIIYWVRELFLWYWKVNEIVKNQERTNYLLEKIANKTGVESEKPESK